MIHISVAPFLIKFKAMAIDSVEIQVIDILPSELVADTALIERFRKKVVYIIQDDTGKSDAEVEDEANYTNRQQILIGYYTAYMYLKKILADNSVTVKDANDEPSTLILNQQLKKAKADVVETEFSYASNSAGAAYTFKAKATEIMMHCLKELCAMGRNLGYRLDICEEVNQDLDCGCSDDTVIPLVYTPFCPD